jgi:hypothetical protein
MQKISTAIASAVGYASATDRIDKDVQLNEEKSKAATAKPVRIRARKVRSFAA